MNFNIELTDTFGGEANYSWVKREKITTKLGASQRQIIKQTKAKLGMTGVRGKTEQMGDGFKFTPYGCCEVVFATPRY